MKTPKKLALSSIFIVSLIFLTGQRGCLVDIRGDWVGAVTVTDPQNMGPVDLRLSITRTTSGGSLTGVFGRTSGLCRLEPGEEEIRCFEDSDCPDGECLDSRESAAFSVDADGDGRIDVIAIDEAESATPVFGLGGTIASRPIRHLAQTVEWDRSILGPPRHARPDLEPLLRGDGEAGAARGGDGPPRIGHDWHLSGGGHLGRRDALRHPGGVPIAEATRELTGTVRRRSPQVKWKVQNGQQQDRKNEREE